MLPNTQFTASKFCFICNHIIFVPKKDQNHTCNNKIEIEF